MIRRGQIHNARLDPTEGSEQAGARPVIIMSRNAINDNSTLLLAVPCSTYRGRRLYPSQVLLQAPDGGLGAGARAQSDPALAPARLVERRNPCPDRSGAADHLRFTWPTPVIAAVGAAWAALPPMRYIVVHLREAWNAKRS